MMRHDPTHTHSLDQIVGYDIVVSTTRGGQFITLVAETYWGAGKYADALAAARRLQNLDTVTGAYPASRWSCGCRFAQTVGAYEQIHDGWDGASRPRYVLEAPCGCRWSTDLTYREGRPCSACLVAAYRRNEAQAAHRALLERLLADGHDVEEFADDPFALRGYAEAVGA